MDDKEFDKLVLQKNYLVFVGFGAPWCGPCKMMHPIIEELVNEVNDIDFVRINVDESPELAGQYNVRSVPTFMLFKNGKILDTKSGANSKQAMLSWIETFKS